MGTFNRELWRRRALARCQRRADAGDERAQELCDRELGFIDDLACVVRWCEESKKHPVAFDARDGGSYLAATRSFRVCGRARPEQQLYLLLHECGHFLIGRPEEGERFSEGYAAAKTPTSRRLVHRIDVLDEEFEAWHRGKRLAGRLGIKIDKKAFDKARTQCMKTYVKWTLRVDGFGGPADDET